jgi:hypothetical protein
MRTTKEIAEQTGIAEAAGVFVSGPHLLQPTLWNQLRAWWPW